MGVFFYPRFLIVNVLNIVENERKIIEWQSAEISVLLLSLIQDKKRHHQILDSIHIDINLQAMRSCMSAESSN